jgi:hypothetical protein
MVVMHSLDDLRRLQLPKCCQLPSIRDHSLQPELYDRYWRHQVSCSSVDCSGSNPLSFGRYELRKSQDVQDNLQACNRNHHARLSPEHHLAANRCFKDVWIPGQRVCVDVNEQRNWCTPG